jgi:hypothetical protein
MRCCCIMVVLLQRLRVVAWPCHLVAIETR